MHSMLSAKHRAEPAYTLLSRLGGRTAVANELELDKSTLSRWCQPTPAGTGGVIPQRYWPQLFKLAQKQGVALALEDLVTFKG